MKKYIYKHDRLKMTSLTLVFDAGAMLEPIGKKGTMHLMEHIICKTFTDMYSTLTTNGIDWNAYTSNDKIVVWFSGLAENLDSKLKLELVSKITGGLSNVTPEVFEQERNVVLQEYLDSAFDNTEGSHLNIFRKYWNIWLPIGKESDIKSFGYSDMLDAYDRYFKKPNSIIDIGPDKTPELENFCEDRPLQKVETIKFGNYENEFVEVNTSLKTPVYMLFPKPVSASDYPYVKVGLAMLCSGLESPYYNELRVKRGLSYYVHSDIIKTRKNGIMYISACTDTDRAQELCDVMDKLADNVYDWLTEERYASIMQMLKLEQKKARILKYEYSFKHANVTKLRMPNNLDKIDLEKVRYLMSRYFANVKIVKGF